jgi:hypothetical protein
VTVQNTVLQEVASYGLVGEHCFEELAALIFGVKASRVVNWLSRLVNRCFAYLLHVLLMTKHDIVALERLIFMPAVPIKPNRA